MEQLSLVMNLCSAGVSFILHARGELRFHDFGPQELGPIVIKCQMQSHCFSFLFFFGVWREDTITFVQKELLILLAVCHICLDQI